MKKIDKLIQLFKTNTYLPNIVLTDTDGDKINTWLKEIPDEQ